MVNSEMDALRQETQLMQKAVQQLRDGISSLDIQLSGIQAGTELVQSNSFILFVLFLLTWQTFTLIKILASAQSVFVGPLIHWFPTSNYTPIEFESLNCFVSNAG